MTYKSDDLIEAENGDVNQSKIDVFELQQEIPISPKSTKKPKAPIPMSFKAENQSETEPPNVSSVRKSRTPSPNSNKTLDDIVLISEVIGTLTEMREPNGKTYFVDEIRTTSSAVDTHEESEQKTAIEYLDDVLKKEDMTDDIVKGKSDDNVVSTSVVAVVHLNDAMVEEQASIDEKKIDLHNEVNNLSEDSIKEEKISYVGLDNNETDYMLNNVNDPDVTQSNLPEEIFEPDASVSSENIASNAENSPIINQVDVKFQLAHIEEKSASNDQQSNKQDSNSNTEKTMTFKERLAMLLGQQPVVEVRRLSPKGNDQVPQNTPEPKLKHSKSEPDIFNSMVMQGVFKDIRSKYEISDKDGLKKPHPLQMTVADDINIDNINPNVPAPPKFDPFIYKTIGSRHNARMALKIENETENEISPKTPATAPIVMNNEHNYVVLRKKSFEDDDQIRMVSIKDRLENILKRGPPDRFSRPKSIVPSAAATEIQSNDTVTVNSSMVDNDDQGVIRIKESKKPFDTVHKQKVLFNDVLKSIGVETRPSIIRANSITKLREKPTTIEGARNALKHISPDWKKNVD